MRGPRIDHYEDMEEKVESSRSFNDTMSELTTFVRWGMRDARAEGYEQGIRDYYDFARRCPPGLPILDIEIFAEQHGITLETDNG